MQHVSLKGPLYSTPHPHSAAVPPLPFNLSEPLLWLPIRDEWFCSVPQLSWPHCGDVSHRDLWEEHPTKPGVAWDICPRRNCFLLRKGEFPPPSAVGDPGHCLWVAWAPALSWRVHSCVCPYALLCGAPIGEPGDCMGEQNGSHPECGAMLRSRGTLPAAPVLMGWGGRQAQCGLALHLSAGLQRGGFVLERAPEGPGIGVGQDRVADRLLCTD